MGRLRGNGGIGRDAARVARLSAFVGRRLAEAGASDEERASRLGAEELLDLDRVLRLADYALRLHEHKREVRSLLAEFVAMVGPAAESVRALDADIGELALRAEAAVASLREAQAGMGGRGGRGPVVQTF